MRARKSPAWWQREKYLVRPLSPRLALRAGRRWLSVRVVRTMKNGCEGKYLLNFFQRERSTRSLVHTCINGGRTKNCTVRNRCYFTDVLQSPCSTSLSLSCRWGDRRIFRYGRHAEALHAAAAERAERCRLAWTRTWNTWLQQLAVYNAVSPCDAVMAAPRTVSAAGTQSDPAGLPRSAEQGGAQGGPLALTAQIWPRKTVESLKPTALPLIHAATNSV
jgi:hypothetical protein